MNWGVKIVVGMATFMIFIVSVGIYMVSRDTDSLMEDDYYEKSLNYDDVYKRKQNLIDDNAKPLVNINHDTLFITFQHADNAGELFFRRPSDGRLDQKVAFATKTNVFALPIEAFSKGNWNIEINWESQQKSYLDVRPLFIQ